MLGLTRHLSAMPNALNRSRGTAPATANCLSCGRRVARHDDRLIVRGATFHARCSVFRPPIPGG